MNITPFDIYLWQMADSARSILTIALFGSTVFTVVWICGLFASESDSGRAVALGFLKKAAPLNILTAALFVAAPSSSTIAMMYVIPELANSKVIKEDVPEVYNAAIGRLRELLSAEVEK